MNIVVKEVLTLLNNKEFEAYIIGGYVRDYLLGIKSDDYDICTNALEENLRELFNVYESNYGSCKIKYQDYKFEITTFRKELNYLNHRKPEQIVYVDSLAEDLKRRDFTINTICMDKDGKIIDLLKAREDLQDKVIKTVGNSEEKIQEDALRILRAIRFATVLNFKLDLELYDSIKKYGYLVKKLSYYRRRQELDKIFTSNNIAYGIKLINELNLAKYLEIRTNFKITSLMGIWAQINNTNYPFTREEKKMMNDYVNETSFK